jgi:hypothetical protein
MDRIDKHIQDLIEMYTKKESIAKMISDVYGRMSKDYRYCEWGTEKATFNEMTILHNMIVAHYYKMKYLGLDMKDHNNEDIEFLMILRNRLTCKDTRKMAILELCLSFYHLYKMEFKGKNMPNMYT